MNTGYLLHIAGFQAGPTSPTFSLPCCCAYTFPYFFILKNTLLSLLFTLKCHLHDDKIINTFFTCFLALILQINFMYIFVSGQTTKHLNLKILTAKIILLFSKMSTLFALQ